MNTGVLVDKLRARPVSFGALLVAAWSVPWILWGCSTLVDGKRFFFLADDPTISLRYGRNLAHGFGLVWNPGERVEGYSNFLWTAYMGLLHLFPISNADMALAVLVSNIALTVASLWLIFKIAQRLNPHPWFAPLAVFACALNGDLFEWMIRGFETCLMAVLLLGAFYRVMLDIDRGRPRLGTHLLIASLTLVRADGVVFWALLSAWAIFGSQQRLQALLLSVASALVPASHFAYRWLYYHDVLPNTAYLKMFGWAWSARLRSGFHWTARFYLTYPVAGALLVAALLKVKDWSVRAAAAVCLLFSAYILYVGGDIFVGFRFLAPVIPLMLVAALAAAFELTDAAADQRVAASVEASLPPALRRALPVLGGLVFLATALSWPRLAGASLLRGSLASHLVAGGLALAVYGLVRYKGTSDAWRGNATRLALLALVFADAPDLLWARRVPEPLSVSYPDNVRIGLYLHDHTPPTAKIADTWAGLPPYFSERTSVDLLGKAEKHIARMHVASEGTIPGHNKFDYDYALGQLKPDYVVAAFKLPVTEQEMRTAATGDLAFIGRLYFNQTFREHCLQHPLPVDMPRTIFRCDWPGATGTP